MTCGPQPSAQDKGHWAAIKCGKNWYRRRWQRPTWHLNLKLDFYISNKLIARSMIQDSSLKDSRLKDSRYKENSSWIWWSLGKCRHLRSLKAGSSKSFSSSLRYEGKSCVAARFANSFCTSSSDDSFFLQRRMSPQRARTWFRPWAWLFPESIVGLATCCCSLPTNPAHSHPAQLLTALRSVSNEPNGHPCQLTQPQANKYALLKKRQRRKISERRSAGFTIPDR